MGVEDLKRMYSRIGMTNRGDPHDLRLGMRMLEVVVSARHSTNHLSHGHSDDRGDLWVPNFPMHSLARTP